MFVKKALAATSRARAHRKELEYLYARRTAINTLIQSLEDYNRYPSKAMPGSGRKSA